MRVYRAPRRARPSWRSRWLAAAIIAATLSLLWWWRPWSASSAATPPSSERKSASQTSQTSGTPGGPTTNSAVIRGAAEPPGRSVPILMYHVIATAPSTSPYPGLYVSPELFAEQIGFLRRRGYHAVTLDQVWAYWHHGARLPRRPIVLSFDDGYLSQYTVAAKLLAG